MCTFLMNGRCRKTWGASLNTFFPSSVRTSQIESLSLLLMCIQVRFWFIWKIKRQVKCEIVGFLTREKRGKLVMQVNVSVQSKIWMSSSCSNGQRRRLIKVHLDFPISVTDFNADIPSKSLLKVLFRLMSAFSHNRVWGAVTILTFLYDKFWILCLNLSYLSTNREEQMLVPRIGKKMNRSAGCLNRIETMTTASKPRIYKQQLN